MNVIRFHSCSRSWAGLFILLLLASGGRCPVITRGQDRIIVITPHNEAIRMEFAWGFDRWHRERYGTSAAVDWRDLGGSSDALRFVQSEFAKKPEGIGIDCFFGGGLEPYLLMADRRWLARYEPAKAILDAIPPDCNGVEIYDRDHTWYGAALSTFGILQSRQVQHLARLPLVLRWEQLAQPELCGWVGAGDPRNSGTMTAMFESFLQAYGWERGWQILTAMGGNVRQFDRISSNTAKDVTLGETAYALAIDFYAFSQIAIAGRTNLAYVLPQDFAAVIPDGIAIFKGAPHPVAAQRFLDFVLSEAGQKLWFLPRGYPGGPRQYSIERMSVRPDFYRRFRGISNIEFSPFELGQTFRYNAQLARERRDVVAALVGALLVDTHRELRAAWRRLIDQGVSPDGLAGFGRVPVTESEALALARGPWNDPAVRNRKKIEWQTWAEENYRHARPDRKSE